MQATLTIRNHRFTPALFCAPMAGVTHSAFRRLVAEFGGCGAMFTEMLPPKAVLQENPASNPYLRRRPHDGALIYQLMPADTDRLAEAMQRLAVAGPDGFDINCACPAPGIRYQGAGADLFEDLPRLRQVLEVARREFAGPLSVKLRLGRNTPGWETRLAERLQLCADCGVDWLIVHPRFADEKLKRRARHELYPWIAGLTRLPVVASGDILGPDWPQARPAAGAAVAGVMLGRIAAAQPWHFAAWNGSAPAVDYAALWARFCDYVEADFKPEICLGRIKIFTAYFARNFQFGQRLFGPVQAARTVAEARERAGLFFARPPPLVSVPNFSGI